MIKHKEIITIERQIQCKHCYATDLHKIGKKKDMQYYCCQECKHKFADNDGYPFMKLSKDLVILINEKTDENNKHPRITIIKDKINTLFRRKNKIQ